MTGDRPIGFICSGAIKPLRAATETEGNAMPSYTVELSDADRERLEALAAPSGYGSDPAALARFIYLLMQMGMSEQAAILNIKLRDDDPADRLKPIDDGIPF